MGVKARVGGRATPSRRGESWEGAGENLSPLCESIPDPELNDKWFIRTRQEQEKCVCMMNVSLIMKYLILCYMKGSYN